jgi:hypothetical protein
MSNKLQPNRFIIYTSRSPSIIIGAISVCAHNLVVHHPHQAKTMVISLTPWCPLSNQAQIRLLILSLSKDLLSHCLGLKLQRPTACLTVRLSCDKWLTGTLLSSSVLPTSTTISLFCLQGPLSRYLDKWEYSVTEKTKEEKSVALSKSQRD